MRHMSLFSATMLLVFAPATAMAAMCRSCNEAPGSEKYNVCVDTLASNLENARGMVMDHQDGRTVVIVVNVRSQGAPQLVWLSDINGDGDADDENESEILLTRDGLTHGIALDGQHLFVSTSNSVFRYDYNGAEFQGAKLTNGIEVINNINNRGQDAGAGFGGASEHTTRTLLIPEGSGTMFISVGSDQDVDTTDFRAAVRRVNVQTLKDVGTGNNNVVDFTTLDYVAKGLRNAVGLAYANNDLWATDIGASTVQNADLTDITPRDHVLLSEDNAADELNRIPGAMTQTSANAASYGYPFCWSEYRLPNNARFIEGHSPRRQWPFVPTQAQVGFTPLTNEQCRTTASNVQPEMVFPAGSRPLGLTVLGDECGKSEWAFPCDFKGQLFIAFESNRGSRERKVAVVDITSGSAGNREMTTLWSGNGGSEGEEGPTDLKFDPHTGMLFISMGGEVKVLRGPVSKKALSMCASGNSGFYTHRGLCFSRYVPVTNPRGVWAHNPTQSADRRNQVFVVDVAEDKVMRYVDLNGNYQHDGFEERRTLLDPNDFVGRGVEPLKYGITVYNTNGNVFLFVSTVSTVWRFTIKEDADYAVGDALKVISNFGTAPIAGTIDSTITELNARTLYISGSHLYMSVGSTRDLEQTQQELDERSVVKRVALTEVTKLFNTDIPVNERQQILDFTNNDQVTVVATGMRSPFGLAVSNGELWVTDSSPMTIASTSDLGADFKAADELNIVNIAANQQARNWGYPACFSEYLLDHMTATPEPANEVNPPDTVGRVRHGHNPGRQWKNTAVQGEASRADDDACRQTADVSTPSHVFPDGSEPMGMAVLSADVACADTSATGFPCDWRNRVFVALHGTDGGRRIVMVWREGDQMREMDLVTAANYKAVDGAVAGGPAFIDLAFDRKTGELYVTAGEGEGLWVLKGPAGAEAARTCMHDASSTVANGLCSERIASPAEGGNTWASFTVANLQDATPITVVAEQVLEETLTNLVLLEDMNSDTYINGRYEKLVLGVIPDVIESIVLHTSQTRDFFIMASATSVWSVEYFKASKAVGGIVRQLVSGIPAVVPLPAGELAARSLLLSNNGFHLMISVASTSNGLTAGVPAQDNAVVKVLRDVQPQLSQTNENHNTEQWATLQTVADGLRNARGLANGEGSAVWATDAGLATQQLTAQQNPASELNSFELPAADATAAVHFGYPQCWSEYRLTNVRGVRFQRGHTPLRQWRYLPLAGAANEAAQLEDCSTGTAPVPGNTVPRAGFKDGWKPTSVAVMPTNSGCDGNDNRDFVCAWRGRAFVSFAGAAFNGITMVDVQGDNTQTNLYTSSGTVRDLKFGPSKLHLLENGALKTLEGRLMAQTRACTQTTLGYTTGFGLCAETFDTKQVEASAIRVSSNSDVMVLRSEVRSLLLASRSAEVASRTGAAVIEVLRDMDNSGDIHEIGTVGKTNTHEAYSIVDVDDFNEAVLFGGGRRDFVLYTYTRTAGTATTQYFVFVATETSVWRFEYNREAQALGNPQMVITGIPATAAGATEAGELSARSLTLVGTQLLLSVGRSNTGAEGGMYTADMETANEGLVVRTTALGFNALKQVVNGVRNSMAVVHNTGREVYAVDIGQRGVSAAPAGNNNANYDAADELNRITLPATDATTQVDLGFPGCATEHRFEDHKLRFDQGIQAGRQWATTGGTTETQTCRDSQDLVRPAHAFQPKAHPTGMAMFTCADNSENSLPCEWNNRLFIAFKGGGNDGRGSMVTMANPADGSEAEIFKSLSHETGAPGGLSPLDVEFDPATGVLYVLLQDGRVVQIRGPRQALPVCSQPSGVDTKPGVCAEPWAAGVGSPRGLAMDTGALLVVEENGGVKRVHDANNDNYISYFREVHELIPADGQSLNFGIAIANNFLFASTTDAVFRWAYNSAAQAVDPNTRRQLVSGLNALSNINANSEPAEEMLGNARTLTVGANSLYISVSSRDNVDADTDRARVVSIPLTEATAENPSQITRAQATLVAEGLRSAVGLAEDRNGVLWASDTSVKNLIDDDLGGFLADYNGADELNRIEAQAAGTTPPHYGYPVCWSEYMLPEEARLNQGHQPGRQWAFEREQFKTRPTTGAFATNVRVNDEGCRSNPYRAPSQVFEAHSRPAGMNFISGCAETSNSQRGLPCAWNDRLVMTFYGSGDERRRAAGYRVSLVDTASTQMGAADDDLVTFTSMGSTYRNYKQGARGCTPGFRPFDVVFDRTRGELFVSTNNGLMVLFRNGDARSASSCEVAQPTGSVKSGVCRTVFAEGFGSPAGLQISSSGVMYVADTGNYRSEIVRLADGNGNGVIEDRERMVLARTEANLWSTVGTQLSGSLAVVTQTGTTDLLFAASGDTVYRWEYVSGSAALRSRTTVVTGLSGGAGTGGTFAKTTLAENGGILYIAVASTSGTTVIRSVPVSSTSSARAFNSLTEVATGMQQVRGLTFDSNGNIWLVDNSIGAITPVDEGLTGAQSGDELNVVPVGDVSGNNTATRDLGHPSCWAEYSVPQLFADRLGARVGRQWANSASPTSPECRDPARYVQPQHAFAPNSHVAGIDFVAGTSAACSGDNLACEWGDNLLMSFTGAYKVSAFNPRYELEDVLFTVPEDDQDHSHDHDSHSHDHGSDHDHSHRAMPMDVKANPANGHVYVSMNDGSMGSVAPNAQIWALRKTGSINVVTPVERILQLNFPSGDFSRFNDNVEQMFRRLIEDSVPGEVVNATFYDGSINVVAVVLTNANITADNFKKVMDNALNDPVNSDIRGIVGNSSSAFVGEVVPETCTLTGASRTLNVADGNGGFRCTALECINDDYVLTRNTDTGAARCILRTETVAPDGSTPQPGTSDSDDGLTDGEIAGIVIGSVVGACLIAGAVFFFLCRGGGGGGGGEGGDAEEPKREPDAEGA